MPTKINVYDKTVDLDLRTNLAFTKLNHYLRLFINGKRDERICSKVKKWASNVAHVVFEAHPELREEGSLIWHFVAKSGRKKGLSGATLTRYVESEFLNGTWYKHVPPELIAMERAMP